eukprot:TRINITY_DN47992_c0_g1_i1.p1 TRINITY_DN47992_c0_g1~~TRINITY_DN47992_c0_g1_i1.p1  ORF type:complete len:547 (+),score=57.21 TRINITY_DN47992_c0_g1_i1:72-1712(+)
MPEQSLRAAGASLVGLPNTAAAATNVETESPSAPATTAAAAALASSSEANQPPAQPKDTPDVSTSCESTTALAAGCTVPGQKKAADDAPLSLELVSALFPGRMASKPGKLMAWGKVGGKGGNAIPVPKKAVDTAGDCVYPAPCALSDKAALFIKASVDMGPFCALDTTGCVWAWNGWSKDGSVWSATPERILPDCVDCAAGSGYVVAVKSDGSVWVKGALKGFSKSGDWVEVPWRLSKGQAQPRAAAVDACAGAILVATASLELWACGSGPPTGLGGEASAALTKLEGLPKVCAFSVGSLHAACAGRDGSLWTWGDGLSGNLGTGGRRNEQRPQKVAGMEKVVQVSCTRGQEMPKRMGNIKSFATGQEGPRCHAITADGALWIAGTTHKGLGANHVSKTLSPPDDHLNFYRVGGLAADITAPVCHTGAAEDLAEDKALAAKRMGMESAELLGKDGQTNYLTSVQMESSCPCHIHSVALSRDGRAWAWGCGSDGRTGLLALMRGPRGAKRTLKCYVSTPSVIEELESVEVTHVTAGRYWSLAIVRPR